MKVDRGKSSGGGGGSPGVRRSPTESKPVSAPFTHAIQEAGARIVNEDLDNLIRQIEEQAEALIKRRTDSELQKYKALIGDFLKTVVKDGFSVAEVQSITADEKFFVISRRIEEKLLQLAEKVGDKTKDATEIAAATSEIRGLLLDLRI